MVEDAVPLGEIARALIVMLRHHGDVLLVSPLPTVLRMQAPRAEIDALVYDDTAPMLEGHPDLARGMEDLTAGRGCHWKRNRFFH